MNKETLRTLEKSICQWNLICMGVETDEASHNCPLCEKFASDDCEEMCIGCPITLKSGSMGCSNTPWEKWNDKIDSFTHETMYTPILLRYRYIPWFVENMDSVLTESLIDLAWDELEFLITLLPEGHKWRETLMKRTFPEWENSKKSWTDFAKAGDEIDITIYDYFLGTVSPIYTTNGFLVGEPYDCISGIFSYMAFSYNDVYDKYFYLGIKTEEEME